jgi:uncharacterized protein YlxP (DUF503 family)
MTIQCATIKLYAPWVNSLKDKRSLVKGLLARLHSKFNISAAEVEEHDTHRTAVIALVCVGADAVHTAGIIDGAIKYVESASEAQVMDVYRETR